MLEAGAATGPAYAVKEPLIDIHPQTRGSKAWDAAADVTRRQRQKIPLQDRRHRMSGKRKAAVKPTQPKQNK